jgi:hypothetical protein
MLFVGGHRGPARQARQFLQRDTRIGLESLTGEHSARLDGAKRKPLKEITDGL